MKSLKSLISNESGVAYLNFIFLIIIVVTGLVYDFLYDLVMSFMNILNSNGLLADLSPQMIQTGNYVMMAFLYGLIYIIIILLYWLISMSMKPETGY